MRALLALAVIGAVVDVYTAVRPLPRLEAPELDAARIALQATRKTGDVVIVSPLLAMSELARLGAQPMSPAVPAPEVFASRRVLVVDFASPRMSLPGEATRQEPLGERLVLRIFEPSGAGKLVVFDLYSDLEKARMSVAREGRVTPCVQPRSEGGRGCAPEPEWLYLARRSLDVEGRAAECVWAHPTTGGQIRIELPLVPAPPPTRKLFLELDAALTDDAATTPDGAVVTTAVEEANRILGAVTVPNQRGWRRSRFALAGDLPVLLEVATPRDGRRHHCINARIVEEAE
ncbi:MAG: hypothetical protein HYV07_07860 [Deltaproteobacteria bacterium]|nr:hypothetical protein [Deltaproteobacteria bacterium]